jgi:small-conductance mechanosensitive channel
MALTTAKPWIKKIAQTGLISKGIVYVLLGLLGFMAAFELGGQQNNEASQSGALQFVKDLPLGEVLLLLLATGLLCYAGWRAIEVFYSTDGEEKKWPKRLRYLFSSLAYLALAIAAFRLALENKKSNNDQNQDFAGELLNKPFGQVLVGLAALALVIIGGYQIYYGLSEKYKKHVQKLSLHSTHASLLLRSGKIGYISRGIVWLVVAFLFGRAAIYSAASEAGDTSKAFQFIEGSPFGSYLLAALSLGLMAYGFFNFIRARYDHLV